MKKPCKCFDGGNGEIGGGNLYWDNGGKNGCIACGHLAFNHSESNRACSICATPQK